MRFDLVILGDTPDAWAAAEDAALLGSKPLVLQPEVERHAAATSVSAVLAAYGDASRNVVRLAGVPRDLCSDAVRRHRRSIERLEQQHGVADWRGKIRFSGRNELEVACRDGVRQVSADFVLIAVGTTSRRPRGLAFDGRTLFLPEDVASLPDTPHSLIILGGNRTARAFARLFIAAGSVVHILDSDPSPAACSTGQTLVGEVLDIRRNGSRVCVRLTDGRTCSSDAVLFATDRVGATASLDLSAAGLETDEDGRLWCDDEGRTWVPTIHAAGEVVGYPRQLRDDPHAFRRMTAFGGRRPGDRRRADAIGV